MGGGGGATSLISTYSSFFCGGAGGGAGWEREVGEGGSLFEFEWKGEVVGWWWALIRGWARINFF